ncbi:hypothetical protein GCM10027275_43230 [Rhabdobacter roseus]|uniref:Phosphatidylglycerophosphate synthase n=1 Tax=Rhabdobacter roseus TaxID=1655419 RepID=A0A840TYD5_9BACT|nr:CDP-alcohol phosphatidyltransferase family protein [Rhabdobacter roseus]MBB5286622.1 phosphatidylglycerophosphate synthase [Rhabdobacter roseus]
MEEQRLEAKNKQRENRKVRHAEKKKLFTDRKRTNILKASEQQALAYLVKRIPAFVTSNVLSGLGLAGCVLVLVAFLLATYQDRTFLLLGVVGLFINWFGDSLDGRLAYYRGTPRKWYGFSLDIVIDWIGTAFIALGYLVYSKGTSEFSAFFILFLYGWAMIISQLRYKVTDTYSIDSGAMGPTEIRLVIASVLVLEVLFLNSMMYLVWILCAGFLVVNYLDTQKLLKLGDARDELERKATAVNRD